MRDEGLGITVNPGVYPPSEDTYLLLKAIALGPRDSFLEVGCGAGLITLNAATVAGLVVGTDISSAAVRNTAENARTNQLEGACSLMQSDLLTCIHPSARFTAIAFNPPYLPEDGNTTDLDYALVGGNVGTELALRFVDQAVRHVSPSGSVYVIVSSLSDVKQVQDAMENRGMNVNDDFRHHLFFEEIHVLRGVMPPQRKPFY